MLERDYVATIAQRLREPRKFMQVVVGPRQTGKSTSVGQALDKLDVAKVEFSFDRPRDQRARKPEEVWEGARAMLSSCDEVVLSLDEVQKFPSGHQLLNTFGTRIRVAGETRRPCSRARRRLRCKAAWRSRSRVDSRF